MDEELQGRIKGFFDYWRNRYKFIDNLDFEQHNHEANVLLWASLDALSNLWAKNIGKKQCGNKRSRLIFDAFLARYGGDLFQIVSLPDVWNRVDALVNTLEPQKLSKDVYTFLSKIGDRREPTVEEKSIPREILADWRIDKIITATLKEYPKTNRDELEEWLIMSRYGAIAYKEMRSPYIHEGRSGKGTHGFNLHESQKRPTYLSWIYTTPPTIGFSVEFMLGVLEFCINSFEANALELQQDPVPPE